MNCQISVEPVDRLPELAAISIAFGTDRILEVRPAPEAPTGFVLSERQLARPFEKDYDLLPGEGPASWSGRYDTSQWGLLVARRGPNDWIGGAVIAWNTPGLAMLEGRRDLAVLWDLRVAPSARRGGVGRALFRAATDWARQHGCRELRVETQNVNPAACRFYAAQGCRLSAVRIAAYPDLPDEVQLLWSQSIEGARGDRT